MNSNARGAAFGAFAAIDAGGFVTSDGRWSEPGEEAEQSAVWAEITAPDVADNNAECRQYEQDHHGHCGRIGEKCEHLGIGHDVVWACHELPYRADTHAEKDDVGEKSEQAVFERHERVIDPLMRDDREMHFSADALKQIGDEPYRTDIATEPFSKKESHDDEGKEDGQPGRMHHIPYPF